MENKEQNIKPTYTEHTIIKHEIKLELKAMFGYGEGYSETIFDYELMLPDHINKPNNTDEFIFLLNEYGKGFDSFIMENNVETLIELNIVDVENIMDSLSTFKAYGNDEMVIRLINNNPNIFESKTINYRTKIEILHSLIHAYLDGSISAYDHINKFGKNVENDLNQLMKNSTDLHDKINILNDYKNK